jgi:hypothetical protein
VYEQKSIHLTGEFGKLWMGNKDQRGLLGMLTACAEHVESTPEQDRIKIAAEMLLDMFRQATVWIPNTNRGEPPPQGAKLEDGSFIYSYRTMRNDMAYSPDKVSRTELSAVQDQIGAKRNWRPPRSWQTRKRYVRLEEKAINALENILHISDDERETQK